MTGDARLFPATAMPDRDWWQALWPDPGATLSGLGIERGAQVLDLCCGDGFFTVPLAQLVAPATVVAVDLLPEMLAGAAALAREHDVRNIDFRLHDVRDCAALVAGPVDVVFMANTFHGVPDKTTFAAAVRSVLRPGGRFVVINWDARPREETPVLGKPRGPATALRLSPEETAALVEPAGFRLGQVVPVGPFHHAAVFVAR